MINVVIVDDHRMVIGGLQRVLELDGRIQVVGTATSMAEAKRCCAEKEPDVILMDLRIPDSLGCAEIPNLKQISGGAKVVVMTGYGSGARSEAQRYGADAFLTKELASETVAETIAELVPHLAMRNDPYRDLSERERQIAGLVASGMTNAEVANALSISPNTVKTHLASVLQKLSLRDRVSLARTWQRN